MKIISWNVNGIRAVLKKGFGEWVAKENPDVLMVQETKAFEHQAPAELHMIMADYDYVWHIGERAGYAGTAIWWKKELKAGTRNEFPFPEFHREGRITEITIDNIVFLNGYLPN